jgi:predicted transcriptional regulator
MSAFKVVDQVLERHACSAEARSSVHHARIDNNDALCHSAYCTISAAFGEFGLVPVLPHAIRPEYNRSYTQSMKTAVSIPDDLFRKAEVAARRLRVSRSQLYAKAIAELLGRQQRDAITERLNEVYSKRAANVDPALNRAQFQSIDRDSW